MVEKQQRLPFAKWTPCRRKWSFEFRKKTQMILNVQSVA